LIAPHDRKPEDYRRVGFPPRRRRYGFWIAFYITLIIGVAAAALLFGPLL
jgi:hypothetical protein